MAFALRPPPHTASHCWVPELCHIVVDALLLHATILSLPWFCKPDAKSLRLAAQQKDVYPPCAPLNIRHPLNLLSLHVHSALWLSHSFFSFFGIHLFCLFFLWGEIFILSNPNDCVHFQLFGVDSVIPRSLNGFSLGHVWLFCMCLD